MDAAGVGCRYFGLGDDRLYFHPPVAHATKEGRPRDDRLFESAGNSLTAVFHPPRSSFPRAETFTKIVLASPIDEKRMRRFEDKRASYPN